MVGNDETTESSLSSVILVNMLNNRRKEKSQHLRKLSDKSEKLRKKNQGKDKKKSKYLTFKFKENDFQIAIGAVINIRCFDICEKKKAYWLQGDQASFG